MPRYFATEEERKYFRDYRRNKYQSDADERERVLNRIKKRKDELKNWYISLKDYQVCLDCHSIYRWYQLDYDHIDADKERAVSQLLTRRCSKKRILQEIEKCELVCSNCHRERTYKRSLES